MGPTELESNALNAEPISGRIFPAQRETLPLSKPGKAPLTGIVQTLTIKTVTSNQTGLKPAPHVPTSISSRLKVDSVPVVNPASLAGRLVHFLPNWRRITADPSILEAIQGYKLEFTSPPVQSKIRQPLQFSCSETEKIDLEISALLEKEALHVVKPVSDQFISNLFLVPKRDGKSRPVINLKDLNTFLQYDHFKMEGIHLLRDLLQPHDWLGKINLKDAYFVIPIWRDHWKYLRFLWKDTLLEFGCLPFGLAVAPRLFTKVMKPVVALLRRAGIRLIIYLDDHPYRPYFRPPCITDLFSI